MSQVVFDLDAPAGGLHTDLPRLAAGGVGAQFWSVYVPASLAGDGEGKARSRPCSSRSTWPAG